MKIKIVPKMNDTNEPFPQANNIYLMLKFLDAKMNDKFIQNFQNINTIITERQISYYNAALKYLSLLDDNLMPTKLAQHIWSFEYNYVLVNIVILILNNNIFSNYYRDRNEVATTKEIMNNYNYSKVTANRRFNTIYKWINWCDLIVKEESLKLFY